MLSEERHPDSRPATPKLVLGNGAQCFGDLAEREGLRIRGGAGTPGFLIYTELMFNEHARAYGRAGCVVNPEGEVVALTSEATPIVFHEIDTEYVARAHRDYPCYVKE